MEYKKIVLMKGGFVDPKNMAKFYEDMFWNMDQENKEHPGGHCSHSMMLTLKQMNYWKSKIKEKSDKE